MPNSTTLRISGFDPTLGLHDLAFALEQYGPLDRISRLPLLSSQQQQSAIAQFQSPQAADVAFLELAEYQLRVAHRVWHVERVNDHSSGVPITRPPLLRASTAHQPDVYLSNVWRHEKQLPPQKFQFSHGQISLQTAPNFCHLLYKIRRHLLNSPSTQDIYLRAATTKTGPPPTREQFVKWVYDDWPIFKPTGPAHSLIRVEWGVVLPGQADNIVYVLSDVVGCAERAYAPPTDTYNSDDENSTLHIDLYNLLLTDLIVRELALAFNKYAYGLAETGSGKLASGSPSPADTLEGALFGGALHVEWKHDEDVGGMDCISRIVISGSKLHEDEDGPFFEIDPIDANASLVSLGFGTPGSVSFIQPPQTTENVVFDSVPSRRVRVGQLANRAMGF